MVNVKVVIGANYGDEGKGLVSGCLARQAANKHEKVLTVFYNGTTQRAHTFEGQIRRCTAAGEAYGSDTFYHRQFVVDPIPLLITSSTPIIDPECRIILPCDVLANRQKETARGSARHGSCGCGLFEAVKRSQNAAYCVRIKDLMKREHLMKKLRRIEAKYPLTEDDLYNPENFLLAVEYLLSKCKIQTFEQTVADYDTVIFEGGQGLLLDQKHIGKTPHLTPSSPGSTFISQDINRLYVTPELYYVSRSYITRHGAGEMECECSKEDINPEIVDRTNQPNEWQGGLRFGKLNTDSLYRRILEDAMQYRSAQINTVFTHLNYTDHKLETTDGRKEIQPPICKIGSHTGTFLNRIFVSDQNDLMETADAYKNTETRRTYFVHEN